MLDINTLAQNRQYGKIFGYGENYYACVYDLLVTNEDGSHLVLATPVTEEFTLPSPVVVVAMSKTTYYATKVAVNSTKVTPNV